MLATDTVNIAVPNAPQNAHGHTLFSATFDFTSQNVVLPSTVVYGIALNQLVTDCAPDITTCGNDPNPISSLNVLFPSNVASGSNVDSGDVLVGCLQADDAPSALSSNLGVCTGAPTGALTAFQGVPVSCLNGHGSDTDGPGADNIPAVELATVG